MQGLFMMDYLSIPAYLQKAVPYLKKIEQIINYYEVDRVAAVLQFVKSEPDIDYLVFGVEKIEQLREDIRKAALADVPKECIAQLKSEIDNVSQEIIFPSLWANGKKG